MNILITNIGRRTYFIDFLKEIKKKYKIIKIFVTDPNQNSAGILYDIGIKKIITPQALEGKKYINSLLKISKKFKIDLIIPVSDHDLSLLSSNINLFKKINTKILISSNKIIKICSNKILMSEFCKKNKFLTPKINSHINKITNQYICKPIFGSGSEGLILNNKDLNIKVVNKKKYIFQKKIIGKEYNIDILNDLSGNYVASCAKEKKIIRSGETDQAKIINSNSFQNFSKKLSKKLRHIGNLDCDIIVKKKKIFIIDLNPRFGGGYPFSHLVGQNYLKFILEDILKKRKSNLKTPRKPYILSKGISIHSKIK